MFLEYVSCDWTVMHSELFKLFTRVAIPSRNSTPRLALPLEARADMASGVLVLAVRHRALNNLDVCTMHGACGCAVGLPLLPLHDQPLYAVRLGLVHSKDMYLSGS
jgi:hypothetical protein